MLVSVALPVYNAQEYLDECFSSIFNQTRSLPLPPRDTGEGRHIPHSTTAETTENVIETETSDKKTLSFSVEISVSDDGSTDSSPSIIEKWAKIFLSTEGFMFRLTKNETCGPKGVGYGRNRTIKQSTGEFICFCDADDVMEPERISTQLKICLENPNAIVGSKFKRLPEGSTKYFTLWANSITQTQLETQIYLSFGPSIVMPTWFCSRQVYDRIEGGFNEGGKGVPEDLIFFYKHLDHGGKIVRADKELIQYRYHENATTFSITEWVLERTSEDEVIWNTRLERLEVTVLAKWKKFSIWNAGKLGRRFYRALQKENRDKVSCFCDVDSKKINQKWYHPYPIKAKVPVTHVKDASPPFVICVKTEMTLDPDGDFKKLLNSLNLQEGIDYFYFN